MIKADRAQSPSRHILTRSKTMRIERIAPAEFKVTPAEKGKAVRIVRFHSDYRPPRDVYRGVGEYGPDEQPELAAVYIECLSQKTGEACPANTHNRHCSHVERAIALLLEG